MPELAFFIGKGGVGKTTISSAYALRSAVHHPRRSVLLISTDPAHSLADIFDITLADSARQLKLRSSAQLYLWQINAEKQFAKFLGKYRKAILDLIEEGTFFSRDEIEPLLDTTLPGMAELAALFAIRESLRVGKYDEIVVDTAPLGHTLRLFEMPAYFTHFLEFLDVAGSRDQILAQHFGGKATASPSQRFVGEWRRMVGDVQLALRARESRIVLVTTPETFALNESLRAVDALSQIGLHISAIVLNRAITIPGRCAVCGNRARNTRSARAFIHQHFPRCPLHTGEDAGGPVIGVAALRSFAEHVFAGHSFRLPLEPPPMARELKFERVAWPQLETPLSLTVGKGGVGKTTISAALAFHQRIANGEPVTICSTDPAPSLEDVFGTNVGNKPKAVLGDGGLRALEVDSISEFRRWSEQMKDKLAQAMTTETKGMHVDLSFDRQVISALLDVVPPGVDEIFAIFRILELLGDIKPSLVIDMAPTGHALELLRMPARMQLWTRLLLKSLAAHRTLPLAQDVAVEIAAVGQRVRELAAMLRDGKRSRIWVVLLAEPLPDRETQRLLRQLQELRIQTASVFVNRVLFADRVGKCRRCRRAHVWQMAVLQSLRTHYPQIHVVRDFVREIIGATALKRFTAELWRIV